MEWSNKMKFNYLIKSTPFLSTIILILFLSISNQKQSTQLKILIWNTPSLTVGTYLAISTGAGFILSYVITTSLAKLNLKSQKYPLKYKDEITYNEPNEYKEINNNSTYDNTLIERDIKDPKPTINASFRIIGQRERSNRNYINVQKDDSNQFEDQYDQHTEGNETPEYVNSVSTDWDDDSFSTW